MFWTTRKISATELSNTFFQEANIQHVAIIMDGNRRWAKTRHLPSAAGHLKGVDALREIVRFGSDHGLKVLTVYAFSTENWKRSDEEVSFLMSLFIKALKKELKELHANNVRLTFIGNLSAFSGELRSVLENAMAETAGNSGLLFQIAANYGGRHELVQAMQALAQEVKAETLAPEAITEAHIEQKLYTANVPDPDLLIRTGGESRLSNYLLWQSAYSEIYITPTFWPDFSPKDLQAAVEAYTSRERRFGK